MVVQTLQPIIQASIQKWARERNCFPYASEDMQKGIDLKELMQSSEMLMELFAFTGYTLSQPDVQKGHLA